MVAVVTDDTSKGCLSDLSQLRWREDSRILIPEPAVGCNHSMTQNRRTGWGVRLGEEEEFPYTYWQHHTPQKELLVTENPNCLFLNPGTPMSCWLEL